MNEAMIIGLIFITVFILINKFSTKKREEEYADLIERTKNETEFHIEQTECFTTVSGLNTRNFKFNHCDLYLTNKAILILGFTKGSFIKDLTIPIILTSEVLAFSLRFNYAYVRKMNTIDFRYNCIQINFGEKGLMNTAIDLDLNSLSEDEKNKIKTFVEKNNW